MTDTFDVTGDLSLADSSSTELTLDVALPTEPNGFVKLGLAPELLQAVADLGYTEPTTVQLQCIPRAMALESADGKAAGFSDLMVSSQTGSGKTAAFLLPVLHTLLSQQAAAEAKEKADFEAACADAIAKGEAPPKRAKRKDPTCSRDPRRLDVQSLVLCPTRELAQQVTARTAIDLAAPVHESTARSLNAGAAACHYAARRLAKPAARRAHRGRHARPFAGPAALDADQARQGGAPGAGRSRPHARPGVLPTTWPKSTSSPSSAARP